MTHVAPPASTGRALEIGHGIGRSESHHGIGEHLRIGPPAVKHHLASMVRRHDVRRRAELVRSASDSHLLG
ncbi:hypothetical protein AB0F91_00040 [Amycolatopsis sp. NPDC023774]|uniref:hypothetical protein n=1 Tax=Amycolatopsis sp. NPDC023774 TaxID=3155015 RepID=UPI0033FBFC5C